MGEMNKGTDIPALPPGAQQIMQRAFLFWKQRGNDDECSARYALRCVNHAGWYLTSKGWERIGPNIIGKVNMREAEKQPNGKFIIRDVDVFYPNAVKGGTDPATVHNADRNLHRAVNTNKNIADGGQAPALTKEHPHPLQKAMGIAMPSLGSCINWKPSNRGKGWIACDIVDVGGDVVEEWMTGKWTGLSAGLVNDANDLGERFGHVALLGVESQALSKLPRTELFSAEGQPVNLNYSAGTPAVPKKGKCMPNPKLEGLQKAFASAASALASYNSGEPGAGDKLTQAFSNVAEARAAYDADSDAGGADAPDMGDHPDAAADKALIEQILGGGDDSNKTDHCNNSADGGDGSDVFADTSDSQEPHEETRLPENPELDGGQGKDIAPDDITTFSTTIQRQNSVISKLQTLVQGLAGKLASSEFSAKLESLADAGHIFDKKAAQTLFSSNPKMGKQILDFISKMPKQELSKQIFSADAGDGPRSSAPQDIAAEDAEVQNLLNTYGQGMTFSAADQELGKVIASSLPVLRNRR